MDIKTLKFEPIIESKSVQQQIYKIERKAAPVLLLQVLVSDDGILQRIYYRSFDKVHVSVLMVQQVGRKQHVNIHLWK